MSTAPPRVLVIRLGALGDLLHVSPSLNALRQRHPEAEIHFLTSPAYREMAGAFAAVDRVWVYDKRQGWGGLFRLAKELRQTGIDTLVNLHPSLKTWLLTRLVRPHRSATYRKQKLSEKGAAQRGVRRHHAVADFYRPFRRVFDLPESLGKPVFHPPDGSLPSTCPDSETWIALIPGVGGKRGNRAWPPEQVRELIDRLLQTANRRVMLIGGPDESDLAERLQAGDPRVENHCGRHDIAGTARLLSQCRVAIGGDTGPLHLAAAVGVPVVALFGPTHLARTGPIGQGDIQALTPPEGLACWPCELSACPYEGEKHLACMKQIPVAAVLAACESLLAAPSASASS